jgi:quinol monooxygenase YgiN
MSLEAALAQDNKDEPYFTNWKVTLKDGTMEAVKASLDALVAPIANPADPRTGVITYAFSKSTTTTQKEGNQNTVYFTELFSDMEAGLTHLTEAEGEAMIVLFQCVQDRVAGYINAPVWHEGVRGGMLSSQAQVARTTVGHAMNPYPKALLGGKWGRRMCPSANDAVMLELRIQPNSKETADRLMTLLTPLTKITKSDMQIVSAYIVQGPGWWRRDPNEASQSSKIKLKTRDAKIPDSAYTEEYGSEDTIDFRVIYSSCNIRHLYPRALVGELAEILKAAGTSEFIVTAADLEHEALAEILEYFQDNGLGVTDARTLLSGYLIHPYFTKDWTGKTDLNEKEDDKSTENKKKSTTAAKLNIGNMLRKRQPKPPTANPENEKEARAFQIRRHPIKDQPEAVVLEARARSCPFTPDCFLVPLLDCLRSITRLGHADKEVPIGTLFGVLERMRSTSREVAYINSLVQMSEQEREELGNVFRVQAFFKKMSLMGRGEYQKQFGNKTLAIDGLEELIKAIETEYAVVVTKANAAVTNGAAIEYLGLQELYKIGSVVTTRSIAGLGGLLVSFKVTDCLFEPIRSLMGSLRYSFRVTLEIIVNTGQHFVAVPFTETIGDWKNVKELANLSFLPSREAMDWIQDRIDKINVLHQSETSFSYMEYPAGSFFPSLGGRKGPNKSSGAASSSLMRAAAGQVIVDMKTGLNLGYAPASRTGELGMAMGYIMKFYLDFIRKATHANANIEELNNAGYLTAYETFPEGVNAQPWPCVIGFSMTTKSWGYTVVDGLLPVLPDPRPWSELVLPTTSREMLMSLAQQKIHGSGTSRYRYNDVIAGKGSGGLYLLYGPPGTGKTLTVEALARFFGKPLYSISFAELGSSTAELEEKLTVTLGLAAHWGSLVLLDEGDALVEKRKQGQLLLNSMTGVLLRLLETFEGKYSRSGIRYLLHLN